jgi:hypothetical protein
VGLPAPDSPGIESRPSPEWDLACLGQVRLALAEGRRSDDGKLHEFNTGEIALAIALGMDIVPVALCGYRAAMGRCGGAVDPAPPERSLGVPERTPDSRLRQGFVLGGLRREPGERRDGGS